MDDDDFHSELLFARLAMALDCEGNISIGVQRAKKDRKKPCYFVDIRITNTNEQLTNWLYDNFAFKIYLAYSKNPKHKDSYHARLTSQAATAILQCIRPYLILKGEQADLAIELQKSMSESRYRTPTDSEIEYREQLWTKARALNQKGVHFD